MPTVADLGQRVKAKYPGAYDDLPDDEVGRRVKTKYPGAYDDFADTAPAKVDPFAAAKAISPTVAPAAFLMDQMGSRSSAALGQFFRSPQVDQSLVPGPQEAIGRAAFAALTKGYIGNKAPEGDATTYEAPAQEFRRIGWTRAIIPPPPPGTPLAGPGGVYPAGLQALGSALTGPEAGALYASLPQAGIENAAAGAILQGAGALSRSTGLTGAFRGAVAPVAKPFVRGAEIANPDVAAQYVGKVDEAFGLGNIERADIMGRYEQAAKLAGESAKEQGVPVEDVLAGMRQAQETETKTGGASLAALTPKEQQAVALVKEAEALQMENRLAAQRDPNEFAAHIRGRAQVAEEAAQRAADARRLAEEAKAARVADPFAEAGAPELKGGQAGFSVRRQKVPQPEGKPFPRVFEPETGTYVPGKPREYQSGMLGEQTQLMPGVIKRAETMAQRTEKVARGRFQQFRASTVYEGQPGLDLVKDASGNIDIAASKKAMDDYLSTLNDYAASSLSREQRQAMQKAGEQVKGYGLIDQSLKTSPLARRMRDPRKTVLQAEAEHAAEGNAFPKYKDVITSGMEHAEYERLANAHARLLTWAAKERGRVIEPAAKVPEGYRLISESKLSGTPLSGLNKQMTLRLKNTALPEQELRFLENLHEATRGPNWGKFEQVMREWKSIVLLRPGFPLRNAYNNLAFQLVSGDANPMRWMRAYDFARGAMNADTFIPEVGMTVGEYTRSALQRHILDQTFAESLASLGGTAKNPLLKGYRATQRASLKFNTRLEQQARVSLDWYFQSKGMAPEKAAEEVTRLLGRYGSEYFTGFVNNVRRFVMPFGAWRFNIAKAGTRAFTRYPGTVAYSEKLRQTINRISGTPPGDEARLPDYSQKATGLILNVEKITGVPGDRLTVPNPWGISDLNKYNLNKNGMDMLSDLIRETYPQWNLPGSMIADALQGRKLKGYPVPWPAIASVLGKLPPEMQKELRDKVGFEMTARGPVGDAWAAKVLYSVNIPQLAFASNLSMENPQAARAVFSFLTGISSTMQNVEEESVRSAKRQRWQVRDQQDQLKTRGRAISRYNEVPR